MCLSLRLCVCVCDGCGGGRNEVAGRVQNHHVHAFQLSQKWPYFYYVSLIFLEIAREIKSCCRSGHSTFQAT